LVAKQLQNKSIKFSDQLSQDNWYLTLATKILMTYTIRF